MASASLSFQPWTLDQDEQPSITELLERVNQERGHFRDIVEASLQEEVAAGSALDLSDSEGEEEAEDGAIEEEHGKVKPGTREELYRAKFDMLQRVSSAHNEVLMALDFVSLLESKDAQAGRQTMSQFLKDNIPAGSLGTDVWRPMPKDAAREKESGILAQRMRIETLQNSADCVLEAAKRLEDNVRKETRYWEEVLSVTEGGWNVCRLPGQQHKLGVRFGFSESAPEFTRRGIAALNAGDDGTISLERGVGVRSKVLRATVYRNGVTVGRSRPPTASRASNNPLETRIRHARDSLFDEELFHEMERESRSMAPLATKMQGSTLVVAAGEDSDQYEIRFDLVSLDDEDSPAIEGASNEDAFAQASVEGVRLLLSQAHRAKLAKRSKIPPPLSEREEERPVLPILRPLLSFILHRSALDSLNEHLGRVDRTFSNAGVKVERTTALLKLPQGGEVQTVQDLTSTLLSPWSSEAEVKIYQLESPKAVSLSFHLRTTLAESFSSTFQLSTEGRQDVRCNAMSQLITVIDRIISSLVAQSLSTLGGAEWDVAPDEALLWKDSLVDGRKPDVVSIKFNGREGTLALESEIGTSLWTADEDSKSKSLWQAWKDII